jgi:predicted TIM-barrel fold metal-dependent hydrolase
MPLARRIADLRELAALPYFDLDEAGELRLADRSVGPIFDLHTHLALSYGRRRPTVDLEREWPVTEHYLPVARPLDLEVYLNRNFTPDDLRRMARDLTIGSLSRGGMRRTHTAPNLVREMRQLGISVSALLPIELPLLSHNAEAYLALARTRPELVAFGSVHPFGADAAARLERQRQAGARGVKLHPAVQLVPPDHARAMALYPVCADLGLPVLWHCGPVDIEPRLGRFCCQLKHYWRAVHDHPRTVFILGHAGALQMEMALELAKRYRNVYLELASQSLGNIRRILGEASPERVMHGSDWPFYHQGIGLAKVLVATEHDPALRRRVLWENAAALLDLTDPAAS